MPVLFINTHRTGTGWTAICHAMSRAGVLSFPDWLGEWFAAKELTRESAAPKAGAVRPRMKPGI